MTSEQIGLSNKNFLKTLQIICCKSRSLALNHVCFNEMNSFLTNFDTGIQKSAVFLFGQRGSPHPLSVNLMREVSRVK